MKRHLPDAGLRVYCVAPTWVKTDMTTRFQDLEMVAKVNPPLLKFIHETGGFFGLVISISQGRRQDFLKGGGHYRGGSRNSLRGGGFWARILRRGGGGVRVQVRGNFHILTSKKNPTTSEGGV